MHHFQYNEVSFVCPVAWSSRKIPRVVRSTLSAESMALSALDRLSWIRLLWEWPKDPRVDITNPEAILAKAPVSVVATDCDRPRMTSPPRPRCLAVRNTALAWCVFS